MKKILPIFLFLFLNLYAQEKAPQIKVNVEKYDFGKSIEGEKLFYDFEISNSGDGDLILKTVRATCGCTVAQPEKTEIKPGESTKIHVEFNTADREGEQQQYIYVYSNDPKRKELRLAVKTDILTKESKEAQSIKFGKLKLDKNVHDFGNVQEGKYYIANIKITNAGDADLEIKNITTTCGCTAALAVDKIVKPGKSTLLKIELDTTDREGKFVRVVNIHTSDRNQPLQTVTLFANIKQNKK
jgi:hypothetical protein